MNFFDVMQCLFGGPSVMDDSWVGDVDKLIDARNDGSIKSVIIPRVPGGRAKIWNVAQQAKVEVLSISTWEADNSCELVEYIGKNNLIVKFTKNM